MFWCLNSTEPFERLPRRGWSVPVVFGLAVRLPGKLGPEHREVVGDDQVDFFTGPRLAPTESVFCFLG